MTLKTARRGAVPPFIVMDVMRAANQREAAGGDVLHLEVGQPSTAAPETVLAAAAHALATERLGYTDALGLPVLRERLAQHYQDIYSQPVDAGRIAVTTGSSGAFILAFLASFDAGDRVVVTVPGYPAYRNILTSLGVQVVTVPVDEKTGFQPAPALLETIAGPIDGLIVASPANPTGTVLTTEALADLATWCRDHGVRLICDEIYHGITYGEPAPSALAHDDDTIIVVNSFSKYYSMTGWRVGWMVLPETLIRPVECLSQNLFISPPTLAQHAALAALDCRSELDAHVSRYQRNRARLMEALPRAGFRPLVMAGGAFYLYVGLGIHGDDSEALCRRMLAEIGVAATPGTDFDPARGHAYVRFSFAGEEAVVQEAAERLVAWKR